MATKIVYEDKVALSTKPDIADKNKITASDMNAIKMSVNETIEEIDNLKMTYNIAKNHFNINGATAKLDASYQRILEFTKTKTGAKLNVISDSNSYVYGDLIVPIVGLEGKEVTLSWDCVGNFELNNTIQCELYYCDIDGKNRTIINQYLPYPTISYKWTIPEKPVNNYICLRLLIRTNYVKTGNYVEFNNIQLEEGTATDYMPYKGVGYTSGTNDYGSWIKFEDGTMICTKTIAGTPSSVNLWANNIYYSDISAGNWANPFTALINVQVSDSSSQYWCNICNVNETSSGTVRILRPDNNALAYEVRILAIGRWK